MRKVLILILITLLLVAGYFVLYKGLKVGDIAILSVTQIQNKYAEVDTKLNELSVLTSIDQPKSVSDLNSSAKQLLIAKEEYNDKVLYSSSENIAAATEIRPYETEYLWTRLGNHAKNKRVNLRYELKPATSGATGQYDIYFTVTGSYVALAEFIAAIESDSSLTFKIENFKISPNGGNTENLQATFTVRDVNVIVNARNTSISNEETTNEGMESLNAEN